jgi:hypothetical protein
VIKDKSIFNENNGCQVIEQRGGMGEDLVRYVFAINSEK